MKPRQRNSRNGMVLVLAIVIVALLAGLLANYVRLLAQQRNSLITAAHRTQAQWLVTAGVNKAKAMLTQDQDYEGEEWQVEADELRSRHAATVTITVRPTETEDRQRRVTVRARFPATGTFASQITQENVIILPGSNTNNDRTSEN